MAAPLLAATGRRSRPLSHTRDRIDDVGPMAMRLTDVPTWDTPGVGCTLADDFRLPVMERLPSGVVAPFTPLGESENPLTRYYSGLDSTGKGIITKIVIRRAMPWRPLLRPRRDAARRRDGLHSASMKDTSRRASNATRITKPISANVSTRLPLSECVDDADDARHEQRHVERGSADYDQRCEPADEEHGADGHLREGQHATPVT